MVSDGDSFVRERAHNEKSDGARPGDVGPDAVGLGNMMPDGVSPDDMTPDAAMTGNA